MDFKVRAWAASLGVSFKFQFGPVNREWEGLYAPTWRARRR